MNIKSKGLYFEIPRKKWSQVTIGTYAFPFESQQISVWNNRHSYSESIA